MPLMKKYVKDNWLIPGSGYLPGTEVTTV